ncbi:hypothetical protein Poli38472_013188 [Pythium oligandrum]|uniref:Sulfatase N-terminal domain-containing protein n=1 Tax=Pythium oligandrum TaxID=41045 RepID=A0A8K1C2K8_PYTOL|nr:hypothetical protein Poli38472_013188 [Pythium oligandrum]|eukprot:TMW55297.1 hypothetical protein Poli38472_013188 [Pythium oligandrum]
MIYRRNANGSRVTTTIPLHNHAADSDQPHVSSEDAGDAEPDEKDDSKRVLARLLPCVQHKRRRQDTSSNADTTVHVHSSRSLRSSVVSHRVYQILWLAMLVYAFCGLPLLGRVLNFVRYSHRFKAWNIVTGIIVGLCQDIAIFVQTATVIVLLKALFQPISLRRRFSSMSSGSSSTLTTSSINLGTSSNSTLASSLAQERYPHSRLVHMPVYFPVRTHEFEMHPAATSSELDLEASTTSLMGKPLTLMASSHSTEVSFPWSSHSAHATSASSSSIVMYRLKQFSMGMLMVLLLKVVLVLATIASIADFCLQVTMHPRLNRAFVEIFVNYAAQFTGSLMDEEVLTPAVILVWATYAVLLGLLTFGFYNDRLPLLPDFLNWSMSSSSSSSEGCVRSCCSRLCGRPAIQRKNSSSVDAPSGYMKSLYQSYWLHKKPSESLPTAAAGARNHRRRRGSHLNHAGSGTSTTTTQTASTSRFGALFGSCRRGSNTNGSTSTSSSGAWMKPRSVFGIVLHCVVMSVFVTLGALILSLLVHTAPGSTVMSTGHSRHMLTVDMQLMANPMFALQTEPFFSGKGRSSVGKINCTTASAELLATIGESERYELSDVGNNDRCALLWRKTVGYQGETLWDINWNKTTTPQNQTAALNATTTSAKNTSVVQPNIILINMESWRYLDVGVLGAAEKKRKFGKSATPHFDRLAQEGILYRKHYSPCVQTTRTLLTTMFGMLPSCTETTALKRYGTSLTVRGLPQFLKSRGYFNLFWSAVDLTWEYWDKFLLANGFDKLVDDKKIRAMLHDVKQYEDRDDDHFSWGMHDHLSFDMLLHALEVAKVRTVPSNTAVVSNMTMNETAGNSSQVMSSTNTTKTELPVNSTTTVPAKETKLRGKPPSPPGTVGVKKVQDTNDTDAQAPTFSSWAPGWEGLQSPFFINMYTISSHNPWALPTDYKAPDLTELYTRFNRRYLDSVYFSDDMLGNFIAQLRAKGLMNNTIVIIEGDHGYGRMEHDNNPSIADSAVYDEASRVPFLILADDFLPEEQRGKVIDQLTMQSDLMATVADILGVSEDEPLYQHGYGHSMRRKRTDMVSKPVKKPTLKHTEPKTTERPAVLDKRRALLCNPFNGMTKGARTEDLKYVFNPDGSFKVFDLVKDPTEKHPVRAGYDIEQMDTETRAMLEQVTREIDLNQFLFETSKFMTEVPKTKMPKTTRWTQLISDEETPAPVLKPVPANATTNSQSE